MRTNSMYVSERELMFAIGGQLFDQAPNREPRNAEIIMRKVRDKFREVANNNNEYYSIRVEGGNLYKYIDELLKGIPEFVDLNLSLREVEAGVKVDDESRAKYSFHTRYDIETSESWKSDFIDLDAFVGNVCNSILLIREKEEDCFGCIYEENHEKCSTCMVNPVLEFNYKCNRIPKGIHTFSCKFDCLCNYMICCEECHKKETCTFKCDGNSKTCGNTTLE